MLDKAVKISAEPVHMGLLQVPVSASLARIQVVLTCSQDANWNEICLEYSAEHSKKNFHPTFTTIILTFYDPEAIP